MKILSLLVLSLVSMVANGALAQNKVEIKVNRIVIDNSEDRAPSASFETVCELTTDIHFQDVRALKGQNALPELIANNCEFEYLGESVRPKIWAGTAAFLQKDQSGLVETFGVQGAVQTGLDLATGWLTSKKPAFEDFELTIETPEKIHPAFPKRKESLRVTYKFYK